MRQRIKLTESDLHRIIRNCVNKTLNEGYTNGYFDHNGEYVDLEEWSDEELRDEWIRMNEWRYPERSYGEQFRMIRQEMQDRGLL